MWAGFGVVMRKFRLDPILATTVAGVFGLATYVPFYLATEGIDRLPHAGGSLRGIEVWVQGVFAGTGLVYTYARAVQCLGAARAAIFPALVPGFATLMGWPVLGHIPTLTEAIGLTLAIAGLLGNVHHRTRESSTASRSRFRARIIRSPSRRRKAGSRSP